MSDDARATPITPTEAYGTGVFSGCQCGVGWGLVCLRGTGIGVSYVAERYAAGESIAALAADYEQSTEIIESALRLALAAITRPGEHEDRMRAILLREAQR